MYHRIGKVSKIVGLTVKRIREYEKEELIKPGRGAGNNFRLYDDFDLRRIEQIKDLIHRRGFTVASIRYLLKVAPCWEIFECPDKQSCVAYHIPHRKCWQIKDIDKTNTLCMGNCQRCPVYLNRELKVKPLLEKTTG